MTPSDVCSAIKFCDAVAHALPWSVIGAVVAALALTYGVASVIWSALLVGALSDCLNLTFTLQAHQLHQVPRFVD